MAESWVVVAVVSVCTMALKSAGPVVLGGRELPGWMLGLVAALAPALLAALVVTQVVAGDRAIVLDDRLLGVAVAAVMIALRMPIIAVIVAAAAVTALSRAL